MRSTYRAAMYVTILVAALGWSSLAAWPIVWDGGSDEECFDMATDPSGSVVAVGYYHPGGNNIWRVAKYDPSGDTLWTRTWDYGYGSDARAVTTDASGNIYVCGGYPNPDTRDWQIIKYGPSGNVLWEKSYDSGGNDDAVGIATDPSGNAIVVGYYHPGGNNIWRVAKYDPSGDTLWTRTWDYGYGSDAQDVAVDRNGNIYVCGGYPDPSVRKGMIIKYSPTGSDAHEWNWGIGGTENVYGIAVYGSVAGQELYSAGTTTVGGTLDWAVQRFATLAIEEGGRLRADGAALSCSPNPFHQLTRISYSLPCEANVALRVFNSAGRVVTTLASRRQMPGEYTVSWDASSVPQSVLPNGTYFCRLEAGGYTATRKMVKTY